MQYFDGMNKNQVIGDDYTEQGIDQDIWDYFTSEAFRKAQAEGGR